MMEDSGTLALIIAILVSAVRAATPLVFAAVGELIVEKAGNVNLGVEGMMLVGAVVGFAVAVSTGNFWLAFLLSVVAGAAASMIYAVLVLTLQANQYAAGLALTIFGAGASAFWGQPFQGRNMTGVQGLEIPVLSDLPVVGPLLFSFDPLVYLSIFSVVATLLILNRSRIGLILRAVGENHDSAHALGYPVIAIRYLCIAIGGGFAGLGGAYLSCVITPLWIDGMTAGRGWIAVALVVFATWRPGRVLLGAYLFGFVSVMGLHAQALGLSMSSHILAMLPYAATIIVLVLISRDATRIRLNAPASLGQPFRPSS